MPALLALGIAVSLGIPTAASILLACHQPDRPPQLGFRCDQDTQVDEGLRFVQLTPPGSACSIAIGNGLTDATPGSLRGVQVVVDDIDAVHAVLRDRGGEVSDVQDVPWGRFCGFSDPDGNCRSVDEAGH